MYDYDYEEVVILALRVMKYLHQYAPQELDRILDYFETFDIDSFYCAVDCGIWSIFEDSASEIEEETDFETISFQHTELNRFYDLGRRWCSLHDCFCSTWQEKIKDAVNYYVIDYSYSVYDMKISFEGDGVRIKVWLSPDCYDPVYFVASLLDLLLYLQTENRRLEHELEALESEHKEAA